MSLEKDIKQTLPFRNEYHKVMVNIIFTYHYIMENQKKLLECSELTGQQYNILRILRGAKKPISTLQIRERMLDKMSDTSRIVDRLALKDLVNKCTNAYDRRLVDVTISEKGLATLAKIDEQNDVLDGFLANLSQEEAETLNRLLDKIRDSKDDAAE